MLAIYLSMIDSQEDKTIFKRLYDKYVNLMFHTAYKILGNQQDAEDAVSEAFLRIAKNFSKIEKNICPKTANQFVIIVRNISIDIYRKNKRKKAISLYDNLEITSNNDNIESNNIEMFLSGLNQSDKDILYMYYIYQMSIKDIKKLFEISEAAAYKRLQRAKSHLKKIVDESMI